MENALILLEAKYSDTHQIKKCASTMNIKTASTAHDQSLNCKPEKLSLTVVILGASTMATCTSVILATLSGERKSLQALK